MCEGSTFPVAASTLLFFLLLFSTATLVVCMLSHFRCVRIFCDPVNCSPQAPLTWGFPGENAGVRCRFHPPGTFPTQGSPASLLLLRWRAGSSHSHCLGRCGSPRKFISLLLQVCSKNPHFISFMPSFPHLL